MALIEAGGWSAFPPRLPEQPIFYPVMNEAYAIQIARDWNAGDSFSGHIGFVTRFEITEQAAARYPVQVAGGRSHGELWIPGEELADFNRHILGRIVVVESYPGPKYLGAIDPETHLPIGFADTHD